MSNNNNTIYNSNTVRSYSPTVRTQNNNYNPFVDERETVSTKPPQYIPPASSSSSSSARLTAKEEKDRLRERYLEEEEDTKDQQPINDRYRTRNRINPYNVKPNSSPKDDLPPSYDEIAKSRKPYPRNEKHSSSSRSRSRPSASDTGGGSKSRKSKKKGPIAKNVDTIDKLDVTALFGGAFHHDGPFDACTPHRNKNTTTAPVLAFPKDGPNSTIKGGPLSSYNTKMNQMFGTENHDDEDDVVYSTDNMAKRGGNGEILIPPRAMMSTSSSDTLDAIKNRSDVGQFDTKQKVQLIHGPTSQGLGSTTFLDGAPAAPLAIKEDMRHRRHETLGRKKSLSQRLKGAASAALINRNSDDDDDDYDYDDTYEADFHGTNRRTAPNTQMNTRMNGNINGIPTGHGYNSVRGGSPSPIKNNTNTYVSTFPDGRNNEDEDVYMGVRFNDGSRAAKKDGSGNKFLQRVKSLKVSRK
ncbi:uncharacterized protein SCODWIG_01061 [Saccharomycodes ludwigii]|uniref:Protein PAL1 n=2 Tax=Saccharomycodes ludwigii TaxID=36035 RepID=A0A376B588_9ASCO|nr:uncharacterized protein SCODWIG_01061 [Saccharomycodes ludwigii]